MSLIPIHDRDGWIWMDGEFIPWREAQVHVLTHALHHGSSVFEGERMYGGSIFRLTDHSQRLHDSANLLDLQMPFSVAEIDAACKATCERMGLEDCYVRPLVWRGSEQMGVSARANRIHTMIAVWEWPSYFNPDTRMKGVRLCWAPWRRPSPDTAPVTAKAAGLYMICTLSRHHAERAGYDDAMMLDWRGYVAEATAANVFFVQDGVLHTPPVDAILNGITRRTILSLADGMGIEVVVRHIRPGELSTFSECFIVGTAAEVTAVAEVGEYRFRPGELTRRLLTAYDDLVHGRA
ncbi:branched-chain amino acid aminotransferase [Brevundimonas sp. 2R-24]|uniref:Branched-chain-amino-acid aminotransferase n=1 Tax=Peiella sedimenti TaxID=3061083 RepID=A0ABT8SMH4_9CAUL|nr:branched-chain amino acid aminotransferase [Caulobacteraceae bacterium XZ-24]